MMKRHTLRWLCLAFLTAAGSVCASTFTVTNTDPNYVSGSLLDAINKAQNAPGPDKIDFVPGLSGAVFPLGSEMIISDASSLEIDASALPAGVTLDGASSSGRIFSLYGGNLHLKNLTLINGNGEGPASGSNGGAIFNADRLTLTKCTLSNNHAGLAGGAIYHGFGAQSLTLNQCLFTGNTAGAEGGAIRTVSEMTLTANQCIFTGNSAYRAGALWNGGGPTTLTQCVLDGNTGTTEAGAIRTFGTLTLTQCSLSNNAVTNGNGGAIYTTATLTSLSRCTLANNSSVARGGAIFNEHGTTSLNHCTVSANAAPTSGAGIDSSSFQGSQTNVANSIIAGNTGSGDVDKGTQDTFTSLGRNIIGTGSATAAFTNNDQIGVDPLLSALAANGGLTKTMAFQPTSPALNAAIGSANTEDQRGVAVLGVPDIGALESAAIVVNTVADEFDTPSGASVSLREALRDAEAQSFATILFAQTLSGQTLLLGGTTLNVAFPVTLDATALPAGITIDGNHLSTVFSIASVVKMKRLIIANGTGTSGGGISISASGNLALTECSVISNDATSGAGIWNDGQLSLIRCTLSGNAATGQGGGISSGSNGSTTLEQCTLADNTAANGAALDAGGTQTVSLTHCTLSQNTASSGRAITLGGSAGLTVKNSIIAGNSTADFEVNGSATLTSQGANVIGNNTDVEVTFPADSLRIGTAIAPVLPQLEALASNGGFTQTLALRSSSPAIGSSVGSAIISDQRDAPLFGVTDIGAFESPALSVTTVVDEFNTPSGVNLSLREAIRDAAANGASIIVFSPALSGQTIVLGGSQLLINQDIAIDGSTLPAGITISGDNASRIMEVAQYRSLVLRGLTLTQGNVTGPNANGGAILNSNRLELFNVTLLNNRAENHGGAIYCDYGVSTVTMTRCTVTGNSTQTGDGGAMRYFGKAVLNHCTVTGNTAANNGGGFYVAGDAQLTLNNSIIAGNSASGLRPDIYGAVMTTLGANLIGNSANVTGLGPNDLKDVSPLLGPLANNGGPTRTISLLLGSPAINAAIGSTDTADQRGQPIVGVADIGAFEADSANANLSGLIYSISPVTPAFASATTDYTATVGYLTDSMTVTATTTVAGTVMTVENVVTTSGTTSATIPLTEGNNVVDVIVNALDNVTTKRYRLTVTRLPSTTDSNGNGITDLQEFRLVNLAPNFHVGDAVNLDLAAIFYPLPTGQTLSVTGLPSGLKFDPGTGLITGTILAELGSAPVLITIKAGKLTAGSIVFAMNVSPYQFAGGFEALIQNGTLPVGKAKLTVTKPGAFSATLEMQGQAKRSAKGSFTNPAVGNQQTVSVSFAAGRANNPPATTVVFVIDALSDLVSGSQDANTLRGFRLAKAGRAAKQPVTIALENVIPGDRTSTPAGIGYATGSASASGILPLKGLLGDAQPFTASLCLSQTNQAVVFVQPYKDKSVSFLGGILTVGDLGFPGRGGSGESQTAGLQWRKIANDKDTSYPLGIGVAIPLSLTGQVSKWVPVPNAEALGLSLGIDLRQIHLGYTAPTADALPGLLSLRNTYTLVTLTPTNAVPFTGKALGTNGTFSGNLTLPAPAAKSAMSGVFLQDESFGSLIGQGLIKVPITAPVKGSFQTMGVELEN
jgi:predicted outer membrane repeat protein